MIKELDLNGVRIYSNTKNDIIDAMDLLGEEVYFSDCMDFSSYIKGKLTGVIYTTDDNRSFLRRCENLEQCGYKYFILAKDAKFKDEKNLRPFKNIDEFVYMTGCYRLGDTLVIKEKEFGNTERGLFVGLNTLIIKKHKIITIFLNQIGYTFEELFDNYLFYKDGKWNSFGIEE